MKYKQCNKCGKTISLSNFKKHYSVCDGIIKEKNHIKEEWKLPNGKYRCPYCDKELSKLGLGGHIYRVHTEKGKQQKTCPENLINYYKTHGSWNKGLTKETDERIKKNGESLKISLASGKTKIWCEGKNLSKEHREKISKARIKYLQENPDKVPYLINHSSNESFPEKVFKQALIDNGITGWTDRWQNGIYQYDFAFINKRIDVEIDGAQHLQEKVVKIDKRRDEWSKSLGWIVIRFTAKEVLKNVDLCIIKLKEIL